MEVGLLVGCAIGSITSAFLETIMIKMQKQKEAQLCNTACTCLMVGAVVGTVATAIVKISQLAGTK